MFALFGLGGLAARRGVRAGAFGRMAPLALTAVLHGIAVAFFAWSALAVPDPTAHAAAATVFVALCYAALHAALGLVFAGYGLWRVATGWVSSARLLDLRIGLLVHLYAFAAGAATLVFWWLMAMLGQAGGPA